MPAQTKAEYACSHKSLADLTPDPRNANKGSERGQEMIANSLRKYGAGRSILLDKHGAIIAGNKTVENAGSLGMADLIVVESDGTKLVAVQRMDLDLNDAKAKQLAIADNRAGQVSLDWDIDVLKELATEIDLAPFWSVDELEAMWPQNADLLTDEDDVPDLPEEAVTKPGDLYILGRHRLLCGDSTNAQHVATLMDGHRASLCFTSPPYNMGKSATLSPKPKGKDSKYVSGDDNLTQESYLELLKSFTDIYMPHSDYLAVNIQQVAGNKVAFVDFLHHYKDNFADMAIWAKSNPQPAMAQNVMNSAFEYVVILSPECSPSRAIRTGSFRGTVSNVFMSNSVGGSNEFSDVHAATFPVAFAEWAVSSFSMRGDTISDPFGGSGTTLIACEKTGRAARLMELDPRYCDVICQRWQDATGQKAVLDGAAE